MTEIMTLDLTAGADEDLLVPFGKPTAPPTVRETQALFNDTKNHNNSNNNSNKSGSSRGFGGLFRRRPSNREPVEPVVDNRPLKAMTYAFPKAHVEHAESEPEEEEEKKSEGDDDDDDDDSSSSGEEEESEYETDDEEEPPAPELKPVGEWNPTDNPYYVEQEREESRSWRMEGFGGGAPDPAAAVEKPKGIGGFFRRLRGPARKDDLQSMKVATEDTKDKKTFAEQAAETAMFLLVPELMEDDGENNLGMYRSIRTTDAPGPTSTKSIALTNEFRNKAGGSTSVDNELKLLRMKVAKLDKKLKSAELEASSWKLRCKELRKELRQYRGQSDEDSSVEIYEECDEDDDDDSEETDDGIEEQWTGYDNVKEGNLLDIPTVVEAKEPEFDPLANDASPDVDNNDSNLLDLGAKEDEPNLLGLETIKAQEEELNLLDLAAEEKVYAPVLRDVTPVPPPGGPPPGVPPPNVPPPNVPPLDVPPPRVPTPDVPPPSVPPPSVPPPSVPPPSVPPPSVPPPSVPPHDVPPSSVPPPDVPSPCLPPPEVPTPEIETSDAEATDESPTVPTQTAAPPPADSPLTLQDESPPGKPVPEESSQEIAAIPSSNVPVLDESSADVPHGPSSEEPLAEISEPQEDISPPDVHPPVPDEPTPVETDEIPTEESTTEITVSDDDADDDHHHVAKDVSQPVPEVSESALQDVPPQGSDAPPTIEPLAEESAPLPSEEAVEEEIEYSEKSSGLDTVAAMDEAAGMEVDVPTD